MGFSGHRRIDDPHVVSAGIERELQAVAERQGVVAAVSSAASGADTLFLDAVVRLGAPQMVILPFATERFVNDFEPQEWQRVEPLLRGAIDVEVVGGTETPEEAYMEAGVRTVDRSDLLIAVLDPSRQPGEGGTYDAVEYARAAGKPVILIDPRSGEAVPERLDRLPPPSPVGSPPSPRDAVGREFERLDALANREAPRARFLVLRIILLHLAATAVAVTPLAMHIEGAAAKLAAVAKLVALVWAAVATWRLAYVHHGWLHSRVEAELCRSFLAMWELRRDAVPLPPASANGPAALLRSLEMAWRLDASAAAPTITQARDSYVAQRVATQRAYYLRRGEGPRRWYRASRIMVQVFVLAAILCALIALLPIKGHGVDLAKLLSILLPLANAAILALLVTQDLGRRTVRYREMAAKLAEQERRLAHVRTWQGLGRAVAETESLLLDEVSEWQSLLRFGSEH